MIKYGSLLQGLVEAYILCKFKKQLEKHFEDYLINKASSLAQEIPELQIARGCQSASQEAALCVCSLLRLLYAYSVGHCWTEFGAVWGP